MSKRFVAVNYITCKPEYRSRFEELFATRAHAIDRLPGFIEMEVLKPDADGEDYLIVSSWESKEAFETWTRSPEFLEGHRRGFADIKAAVAAGKEPPMRSSFKTYRVMAR